jgi:two-component system, cell cycle response regulator DivK
MSTGILVVDDNTANVKLLRILLEREGYEVRTAVHAEDALRVLSMFNPRMILMDVQLPGMDGLELTRRLKTDSATKDIVILALTASGSRGDEEKAFEAGCDGYVAKPIEVVLLPGLIAEYLAAQPAAP